MTAIDKNLAQVSPNEYDWRNRALRQVLTRSGNNGKILAAHRAGVRTIVLPEDDMRDLDDAPQHVGDELELVPVGPIDRVLGLAMRLARPASAHRVS